MEMILVGGVFFPYMVKAKEIPFLIDPANEDKKFMRSVIRHDILPNARLVNPGIEKTIKKLVEKSYEELA